MTHLESKEVEIHRSAESVFQFFSDIHNIGLLMPEQVESFTVSGETCTFTIKGMATLGLCYKSKTPNSKVVMTKFEKAPFDFDLSCSIMPTDDNSCRVKIEMDADLNAFLKMMAEKPLTNFLNLLADKYQSLSNA